MKFLSSLAGFLAFIVIILQLSGVAVIGYMGYFIYTNGIKALLDALWLGFGA